MRGSDVMTRDIVVVRPDDTLEHAARLMALADAGSLPVGENDRLVGMITDRDIAVRAVSKGKHPETTIVGDVMTPEVKYCFEDEDAGRITDNMAELQLRRLPVVNRDKRLVGIVSLGDLATVHDPVRAGEALGDIAQPGGP